MFLYVQNLLIHNSEPQGYGVGGAETGEISTDEISRENVSLVSNVKMGRVVANNQFLFIKFIFIIIFKKLQKTQNKKINGNLWERHVFLKYGWGIWVFISNIQ
jgi:hypothetical protein